MAKKRFRIRDKQQNTIDYDISAARITLDGENGKDLPTKLAEMETQIGEAGSGDGTVKGVKMNNGYPIEPDGDGVVDLGTVITQHQDISGKVDKNGTDSLMSADEHTKLAGIEAGAEKNIIKGIKANGASTNLPVDQNGVVELPPAGSTISPATASPSMDGTANVGSSSKYAREDHVHPHDTSKANDADVVKSITINGQTQTPQDGNVSFDVQAGETVVINSDGANIVDGQSDSILTAPSSRMVKEIYLNLQKLFDPVNGLANIAFVGTRPTWQNVAIPAHTITLGTMSNVAASINGTAINGSASAPEGEVTILLTPTGNNYMGSISVKDASNNDVNFTQTDVAGGTEITFILSGNVTISASASSGIQVNVSGTGITSYTTGVQPNTAAQLTIALPEHHTWGTVTVSYGGADITSQCTISQANNADKVITLPNNLSDMSKSISIVANTVEDAHVTLAISGSNFVVKQGNAQLSNGSKVYNGSAAQTLTIEPASGYKFSTQPSADNGTMTNNGPYEASSLEIGTSVSGTLTITAAGSALQTFNIDLSGLVGVTSSNAATSILEGSPYSTTLSKTDASAAGSVIIGTCTMGNEDITPPSGSTISVAHVTGNIVIAASVGTQPMKVHSWGYSYSTDSNGKKYLNDGEGDFWLYKQADAGYNTTNIPADYYANSIEGRTGYGAHRNLGIPLESSFTLKIKGLVIDRTGKSGSTGAYLNKQHELRLFDRQNVNQGSNGMNYGQFRVMLSAETTGTSADQFYPKIEYCDSNGSIATFFFSSVKTDAPEPDGHQYDYVLSYNASTKEINVYRVDIYNGGVTVELAGTKTANDKLILPTIAYIPSSTYFKGLDVYNYALNQSQIEQEYSSNN